MINKLRALCTWYTKGFDSGSRLRIAVNAAESLDEVRDIIAGFFATPADGPPLRASAAATGRARRGPLTVAAGLRVAVDLDGTLADLSAAMHAVARRELPDVGGPVASPVPPADPDEPSIGRRSTSSA